MFCKYCGNFVRESDRFCQSCGAKLIQDTNDPAFQTSGQPVNQVSQQAAQNPLGMKWYKFVVNVQLFLSMFMSIYNGGIYFKEAVDADNEERYTVIPEIRVLNIVFGIIQFLYVGFLVVIRYRMVKFKKNAPALYILNFVIQIILAWAWIGMFITYTGIGYDDYSSTLSDTFFKTFGWVIYIVLNISYFKKRKFMFSK